MPRRRPTSTTLRGWTRGLPPLGVCFGLMFLFAWLETQRLDNEYRTQELVEEIQEVKAANEKLRERRYRLNRMERMEQQAPSMFLTEADPGQIVIIKGGSQRETPTPENSQFAERTLAPPTRSVVFRLGPPDDGSAVTTLQHEVARMESDQGPPN